MSSAIEDEQSSIVLLWGEKRQSLGYFVSRLWHYLQVETQPRHELVEISFRYQGVVPDCAAAWENRIGEALRDPGVLADVLAERLRHAPLFLMLCDKPVNPDRFPECFEREAFEEFLGNRLPTCSPTRDRARLPVIRCGY